MREPVMYHDGTRWWNWSCHDVAKGNVGIFVGGGPSLNKIETDKLCGPGKTVIGVNNTYPKVRPDIWVGMDDPNCYHSHVFYEGFPKIMRGGYQEREFNGKMIMEYPNTLFSSVGKVPDKTHIFDHIGPATSKFVWHKNVFATTMNLMLYMGFKDIYLAGVDFSMKDGQYHNGDILNGNLKKWNEELYESLSDYLQWLSETARMAGINFYSISPDSPINEFIPYVSLEDLNRSIELPEPTEFKHCTEVESPVCSDEYKQLLRHEHSTTQWGIVAGQLIDKIHPYLDKHDVKEVLDYGAGSGSFSKALDRPHIKVYEYDPGIPEKDHTPEPREFMVCIDVMEHVEPKLLDGVLDELRRVTEKAGYLSISTIPARRILKDGRNAHLIVEDADWWLDKLRQYFDIGDVEVTKISVEVEVFAKP